MNLFSPFSAVAACLTSWQKPDRAPAHKVSLSRLYPYSLLLPLAVLLLGSVTGIANAQSSNKLFDNPEPLHPQEAFIPEVTRVTAETIHVG